MSVFKPKVDIKSISLLIGDNDNRKVRTVETQRKQKTDGVIFRIFVLEIDRNIRELEKNSESYENS